MIIDPQNNKPDQILSHKCLVRACQNDPGQSPEKSEPEQNNSREKFYQGTEKWLILFLLSERQSGYATDVSYVVGAAQKRLTNCLAAKWNSCFKTSLMEFRLD